MKDSNGGRGKNPHVPLLCCEEMSIHSRPLLASLLATMLRTQSRTVLGDSRSHKLKLLLLIVVSVITCTRH